jgi:hypothetical protein
MAMDDKSVYLVLVDSLWILSLEGKLLHNVSLPVHSSPDYCRSVAVSARSKELFLVDRAEKKMHVYSKEDGVWLREWPIDFGCLRPGLVVYRLGLTLSENGDFLFLVDLANERVLCYTATGKLHFSFQPPLEQRRNLADVCLVNEKLCVCDWKSQQVLVYSLQ